MSHGIITAGHEKTAQAAEEILARGGNAFDAIVGAGFAACVAESVLASLGGGGFLLAHTSDGLERVYDFFVQTPRNIPDPKSLDFFPIEADFGPTTQEFHIGLGSMATPGIVAGFFEIHQDLGRLPIAEVMAPAIEMCREGVPINAFQEYLFKVVGAIYSATPGAREVFSSSQKPGELLHEGDLQKFPQLKDTLEALSREGKDLFYQGELAQRLVKQCQDGGTLSLDDLAHYEVHKRKPLQFFYRGNRLLSNPPPSCGGILIAFTLNLLNTAETEFADFGTVDDLAPLAHAMGLTNKARLDALAESDEDWLEACYTLSDSDFLEEYRRQIPGRPASPRGTTHLNVIDGEGNVATLSLSNGEGCGHILKGTGIMMNNMLGEEDLNPSGFHQWQANQRMSSMMSPTILFRKDDTMIACGSGGSNRIRTAIVQVLKNLVDHHKSIPEAVEAPRIHYERGLLSLEPGLQRDVVKKLCREFPKNHLWDEKNLFFGGVHTLGSHPHRGFEGQGDSRRFGVCVKI